MLNRNEPSVNKLLQHVEQHSDYRRPEPAEPVVPAEAEEAAAETAAAETAAEGEG